MVTDIGADSVSPTTVQSKPDLARNDSGTRDAAQPEAQPAQTQQTQTQTQTQTHQHRQPKQSHHHHAKHHHVGRAHSRVPSSKTLHKQHGPPGSKLTRRITSPPPERDDLQRLSAASAAASASHRRATSEIKLPREFASVAALVGPSNIKRNRSHVDIGKRTRSSDKLKRSQSGTNITSRGKSLSKGHVQFDLGDDEVEDEWVDASGSNSPYLSRKGSINSSAPSSKQNSRPETPNDRTTPNENTQPETPENPSTPERERKSQRQYLTSRLLQRTPSHGAPPQVSSDTASVGPPPQTSTDMASGLPQLAPESLDRDTLPNGSSVSKDGSTFNGSSGSKEGLTSRFMATPDSGGIPSEGSFFNSTRTPPRRTEEIRRPRSAVNLSHPDSTGSPILPEDNSALVPRPGRRGPLAETSRIQQKLNLQRASSEVEPGQTNGTVVGASPLIGVGGAGHDGGNSRDPRVGKLLERTGMEYLVVRRYQNPIARSIGRLNRLPDDKMRPIPKGHTRNGSGATVDRRPETPRRETSLRTAASSFDGTHEERYDRLSGSSLVGSGEDDTHTLLRNLWEKSLDLAASTD